jgi:hypothetical protein
MMYSYLLVSVLVLPWLKRLSLVKERKVKKWLKELKELKVLKELKARLVHLTVETLKEN